MDLDYLRHEYTTIQGGEPWTNGWTPEEARSAVTAHLRGMFSWSAALAVDCVRYPPIFGALEQRLAPALGAAWAVEAGGEQDADVLAAEDCAAAWASFRTLCLPEVLRDMAFLGPAWVHQHWVINARGVAVPVYKHWPLEAVVWRALPDAAGGSGYYAVTSESGLVRMRHGDGKWMQFGLGARPHRTGAIVALPLSYVGGELGRRDRAGLSEAAGRAAPVAELPTGIAPADEIGVSVQRVVAGLGRARIGAVVPHDTKITPFQIASDTQFFREGLADEIMLVAFALLGQAGTMMPGSGGVYQAPVFGAVAESVVSKQHEAIERGFTSGSCVPLTLLNYAGARAPTLKGERPTSAAEAKAEGERALMLAQTIKAQHEAGLAPTQGDVDDLAKRLRTRSIRLAALIASPPSTAP